MGGWYSGYIYGRGVYPPFTAFGVFMAGSGGLLTVIGIVPCFFFPRESGGGFSGQGPSICAFKVIELLFTTISKVQMGSNGACGRRKACFCFLFGRRASRDGDNESVSETWRGSCITPLDGSVPVTLEWLFQILTLCLLYEIGMRALTVTVGRRTHDIS